MNENNIIFTNSSELKKAFWEWHHEVEAQKSSLVSEEKSLSINQVAKRLGRAHSTIKKMIKAATLKTTSDEKRITEASLSAYLQNNKKKY
jgi:IS30 family transposase